MAKLKTYNEFVNEAIADVIKTPVKYIKIKNNLKKYQKAKVAQALNDVDFAKRKAKGAGDLSAKQKEVLVQANKAKNAALADTTAAVSQRMKDLATTPILKKVVTVGTTKSRMAANKIALKSATGEEAKQLKIKATELSKKASKATGELKDYESTAAKKAEKPAKAADQNTDDIKTKPETTEAKPKTKESAADKKKAEKKQELGNKIGDAMKAIERAKAEGKSEEAEKAKAVEKLNSVKGTEEEGAASKAVAAFATAKKSREDAIKKLQDNIKDLQKQQKELNESVEPEYVEESESAEKGLKAIPAVLSWDIEQFLKKQKDAKKLTKGSFTDLIQALHSRGFEDRLNGANLRNFQAVVKKHIKESVESESFEYVAESVSEKFARLRPNL